MSDLWRDYQAFRADLVEATKLGNLNPGQIADQLEAALPVYRCFILDYEISAYRRSPDDWRGVVLPQRSS